MNSTKKVSQISEKELVSILDGDIIVTKLDGVFVMVGKSSGITKEKSIVKELDLPCEPSTPIKLFDVLSDMNPMKLDYTALVTRDQLNSTFVLA